MSLGSTKSRLQGLHRDLMTDWALTREIWKDGKAAEFEALYLRELTSRGQAMVNALEELEVLIRKIHQDCE